MKIIKIIIIIICVLVSYNINAYTHYSPYSYCVGDPINYVDPNGCDVVVLNFGNDIKHEHLALLIQNNEGKWQYYSINGDNFYLSGKHKGGRTFNDIGVGEWDTPLDFLNSQYNNRNENTKDNSNYNHFGFREGYLIYTSTEQDAIMRTKFENESHTKYTPLGNNCATIVQRVLLDAGIPIANPNYINIHIPANHKLGEEAYEYIKPNINPIPDEAYKAIKEQNPDGKIIIIK